jgi:hypothetical protein
MLAYLHTFWHTLVERLRPLRQAEVATDLDRRQWMRFASRAETVCKPVALGNTVKLPARVRDVSFGGINLLVSHHVPRGELLHVELPGAGGGEPNLLACVVQVDAPADQSWALGCSFIRELDERELKRFL